MSYQAYLWIFFGFSFVEAVIDGRAGFAEKFIRWPTNIGLMLVGTSMSVILPSALVLTTLLIGNSWHGLFENSGLSFWPQTIFWAMITTFLYYWLHRASHAWPHLWRFHKVHHSDTKLDASTGFRHHPIELVISYLMLLIPVIVLEPKPEVIVFVSLIEGLGAMYSHSNLQLPAGIDKLVSLVITTPRIHNLHHSSFQPETDTNYGGIFMVWDYVFRTYLGFSKRPKEDFRFGLDDVPKSEAEDLVAVLVLPFRGK